MKNIARILIALFFWAAAYKVFNLVTEENLHWDSIIQACKDLLMFRHEGHLYYLHMMLIVYVCLPITRHFVTHAEKHNLQYALGVWFVFGIIYPTFLHFYPFQLLQGIPVQWCINMTYASIGYGLLGYYLKAYNPFSKNLYNLYNNRYCFCVWRNMDYVY